MRALKKTKSGKVFWSLTLSAIFITVTAYALNITRPSKNDFSRHALTTEENVREMWDRKAAAWQQHIGVNGKSEPNRLYQSDPVLWDLLGDVNGQSILDLGCGTGYLSQQMARKGATVIGIDLSSKMIDIASQAAAEEGLNIDFHVDTSSSLASLPDHSLDKIVSNYVLMDIPNLEETLSACNRVLKPGGSLVLIFLHPCFPLNGAHISDNRYIIEYGWEKPYFERHEMVMPSSLQPSLLEGGFSEPFIFFHRSISDYWTAFRHAGFRIDELKEPHLKDNFDRNLLSKELVHTFETQPISIVFLLTKDR